MGMPRPGTVFLERQTGNTYGHDTKLKISQTGHEHIIQQK
jgi:hypothetical protein